MKLLRFIRFGRINHHQLPNKHVLHNLFTFHQTLVVVQPVYELVYNTAQKIKFSIYGFFH